MRYALRLLKITAPKPSEEIVFVSSKVVLGFGELFLSLVTRIDEEKPEGKDRSHKEIAEPGDKEYRSQRL